MAWSQLSITDPHLVYLLLGGFTFLFFLCSSFIKERIYLGEATVATICGICFGPYAARLIDPTEWGSVDIITIEFSRIILVVQCFAVGVDLPKFYMERHWRSILVLLLPVTTISWLLVSLFVWWMISPLSWLESLVIAACITGTDPILASSVLGQNKFAKRVPKHLRDLISAESGCNDAMSFLFVYLAIYLIRYDRDAKEVSFYFIVYAFLYECIFGALFGLIIGYTARYGVKFAERNHFIDRYSLAVFYFMLALFCAGSGSILGLDDLLVGFAAGVGFSNDGSFRDKAKNPRVSNAIDFLLNLAYFIYLGTIIPWEQYNNNLFGVRAWRLAVIAILVLLFRRIPIVMALKPLIPDIRTWREAIFVGHFGPIGAGAIFIAMLARAQLEHHRPVPLPGLPPDYVDNYTVIYLVWPIVSFLVISSVLIHGSSIAVFTLGKRINTLSLTISYTKAPQEGPIWMDRLPRLQQSQSKENSFDEQHPMPFRTGSKPDISLVTNEIDFAARFSGSLGDSEDTDEIGKDLMAPEQESGSQTTSQKAGSSSGAFSWTFGGLKSKMSKAYASEKEKRKERVVSHEPARAYQFGNTIIVEGSDGEVIRTYQLPSQRDGEQESSGLSIKSGFLGVRARLQNPRAPGSGTRNTEMAAEVDESRTAPSTRPTTKSSAWSGFGRRFGAELAARKTASEKDDDIDSNIRFAIGGGGQRMTKDDFIREVQQLNNRTRKEAAGSTAAVSPVTSSLVQEGQSTRILTGQATPVLSDTGNDASASISSRVRSGMSTAVRCARPPS